MFLQLEARASESMNSIIGNQLIRLSCVCLLLVPLSYARPLSVAQPTTETSSGCNRQQMQKGSRRQPEQQ